MVYGRVLLLGLLAGVCTGCAAEQVVHSASWLDRLRPQHAPPDGPAVVCMDVALLERPVGDPYINRDLWASADEQVVSLDRKAVLEENGFRVGEVGGMTPAGLQSLLNSERSNGVPRRIYVRAGQPLNLLPAPLTIKIPSLTFQMPQDAEPVAVTLDQAECNFKVTATASPDGGTRLHFEPEVRHGALALVTRAAPDGSGWMLQPERPLQAFPSLAWDVTLTPNQYIIVGTRLERTDSLGLQFFLRRDTAPVQRLLVLRCCQTGLSPKDESGDDPESTSAKPTPLAVQAAWTSGKSSQ